MGSGVLIQSLMPHGLIDEYVLLIHPLVLGSGHKLFQDGSPLTTHQPVDSVATTKGTVIATYQLAEAT
jgi:dihydrofolate reductase